jgi:hypothetical protein
MEKYLRLYAEPEIAALDSLVDCLPVNWCWENVVVIPACNESARFLQSPPDCKGRSLMILVINETIDADEEVSSSNRALAGVVRDSFELIWRCTGRFDGFELSLYRDSQHPREILLVDRFSEGCQLVAKGGVGHARKIGADLACDLINRKLISSPWICCTDADVHLPANYFNGVSAVSDKGVAALVYPFRHSESIRNAGGEAVVLATQLYDLSLRYYVAGMCFAGSPYDFHTIGSTMAVSAGHYAKVRGFPKRQAGEDFYLLNKLAKTGRIQQLQASPQCKPINIESRCSDRVPFGTGAAVNKIIMFADPLKEFRFYDPAVFVLLRLWVRSLPVLWKKQSASINESHFPDPEEDFNERDGRQVLVAGLKELGTDKALDHAFRQSKNTGQFIRQVNTWFDAFRSLKLIHYLRDNHLPGLDYSTLDTDQTFRSLLRNDPDLLAFHTRLRQNSSSAHTGTTS